jgi:Flp pilus assembly protein TadG
MRTGSRDRGSITLELTIITPVILLVLALTAMGGRVASAHSQVQGAARDAARAASLSRGDARADAKAAAVAALAYAGWSCNGGPAVSLDRDPVVGEPVVATVTCTVSITSLGLPGVGDKSITESVVSPVDKYVAPR